MIVSVKKPVALVLSICLFLTSHAVAFSTHPAAQADDGLRIELPKNGNLRIDNLRGGVIAEVWNEDYVYLSAITDRGLTSRSPAIVQRTDTLLTVRVPRNTATSTPVNLELKIPARTHAAIYTGEGSIEVRGVPAALLTQTVSGETRVELSERMNASITADSKTGNVTSSFADIPINLTGRPQVQVRLGNGGQSLRLISQAGNITLARSEQASRRNLDARKNPSSERIDTLDPRDERPTQRPELIGAAKGSSGAGVPAKPSTGPEEVSEGDVIRVDTELVSVNMSIIDRNTNRGINDLTKSNFRLYEDSVEQRIVHFDSASAPFNLVLLIDLSGSTAKVVDLIKAAALHFVDAARPFDRIGVITFAGGQVVVSPLTTERDVLRQRISGIEKPEGSTKLYDSLAFAMDEVFREAKDARRNAIVVMSDGLDSLLPNVTGEGSTLSYEDMIRRTREFDGVIYSIWVDTQTYEPLSPGDIQQETFDLAHDRMKEVADTGGGGFYECKRLEDLGNAYERVVADLGTLYTLSYRPSNKVRDGSWRTIRVSVNRPNVVPRGKRGYYAK